MNLFDYKAVEVWFTNEQIWVKLEDGRTTSALLSQFPLLAKATPEQLQKFEIRNGYALYWPELDEDLSVNEFFKNRDADNKMFAEKVLQTS